MNINIKLAVCLVLFAYTAGAYAQQKADSTQYQIPVNNAINNYKKTIVLQSGLYNGPEYVFYNRQKKDNVFYQDQSFWVNSTINYNGATYTNVPLVYDLYKNEVVALLYNKTTNYILIPEKLTSFTFQNHFFIYRNVPEGSGNLKSGIYDQLYSGKTEVLVRRTKSLLTLPNQDKLYPEADNIFIKKAGKYYEADSKGSLLSVLKDRKKDLRKFINDNNLDFKENKDQSIARAVIYYDTLTQ
ncbi:MAG TPA: hypothetical protein VL490_07920 [Mucilaginibacter sp.]|nr:hypothetical protein [Mucilaginibacter sp.]